MQSKPTIWRAISPAAVALGAILSAVKVTGKNLKDQQIVIFGAGSAAIGVADGLREAMKEEGVSDQEARSRSGSLTAKAFCIRAGKISLPSKWFMRNRRTALPVGLELPTDRSVWLT
jgi:hypothetical protein